MQVTPRPSGLPASEALRSLLCPGAERLAEGRKCVLQPQLRGRRVHEMLSQFFFNDMMQHKVRILVLYNHSTMQE